MQKTATFLLSILLYTIATAQVTLEKKYDYSTAVAEFETHGCKYFLMDVPNGQCRIYNLDHSLFRSVNCNVPGGYYLYDIKFLSESLFNNDPGIELLCTFYKYDTNLQYYEYDSKIIDENGTQLIFIDGALYNYINKTGENEFKLFSYCYDFSVWPEKVWTNIYNLPGNPVSNLQGVSEVPEINMNAFPNPAEGKVKMAYSLPEGVSEGNLLLYDNTGKLAARYIVDNHTDHLLLDVSGYQSGVYHYFIEYGGLKCPAKKLVITK